MKKNIILFTYNQPPTPHLNYKKISDKFIADHLSASYEVTFFLSLMLFALFGCLLLLITCHCDNQTLNLKSVGICGYGAQP